jgi:sarcosine oxidase, subunit gamma
MDDSLPARAARYITTGLGSLSGRRSQPSARQFWCGYTSVLLQGKQAADALQHCTVYNLHALTPNKVVGTTFGKASVIMYRLDDGFYLVLRRSFADYIWRYLERAAQPYGFGITKT